MISKKDILDYIDDFAPVPYSYICHHFGVNSNRISQQIARLKNQGMIRRVNPPGEGPLWILCSQGLRRLEHYDDKGKGRTNHGA